MRSFPEMNVAAALVRSAKVAALRIAVLCVSPVLAQTNASESQDQWQYSGASAAAYQIDFYVGRARKKELMTDDLGPQ